ncbi:lytic murein transglycosylase [Rhodobacteraceae bacterium WD3A24]|nr:lytic murein transglycosylase [Rhodobacteraceae bacterium WD3A24]
MRQGLVALTAALAVPGALIAQDFTFRRVTPPPDGATARITVQIDPEEQARRRGLSPDETPQDAPDPDAASTENQSRHGWFWEAVAPGLDAGEGRYQAAVAALQGATPDRRVAAPRLERLRDIARQHGATLLRQTAGRNVSPALALAVIAVESSGDASAESRAGAQGLMQLVPATASRFEVGDSFDAGENIAGGVAYLDWLIGHFEGDVVLALAGYNAGENAVRDRGGVPPFAETRDYVPRVLSAWLVARGLCRPRPELPTDPCVLDTGATG